MPRWLIMVSLGGSVLAALACNDETVEVVDKSVCYSEMRWVGEKRGSPEMFPGRDCVGCHIDNDGPPLAFGGTLYNYVALPNTPAILAQTGTDCFGIEGIDVTIEDNDGQVFTVTTNRAGNFYVEGNADDFEKPFTVSFDWTNPRTDGSQIARMFTPQVYGGCNRCHDPAAAQLIGEEIPADEVLTPTSRIGLPGYGPGADGFISVDAELTYLGCVADRSGRGCDDVLAENGPMGSASPE